MQVCSGITLEIACSSLDSYCSKCNSSTTCLSCSSEKFALGKSCVASCTTGITYNNNGLCTGNFILRRKNTGINLHDIACSTLNNYCTSCNSSSTCTGCSSSKVALGSTCIDSCPSGTTYNNGGVCICKIFSLIIEKIKFLQACLTLDDYCTSCNSSTTCLSCSSSKYAFGPTCVASCPSGTYDKNGICTCNIFLLKNSENI